MDICIVLRNECRVVPKIGRPCSHCDDGNRNKFSSWIKTFTSLNSVWGFTLVLSLCGNRVIVTSVVLSQYTYVTDERQHYRDNSRTLQRNCKVRLKIVNFLRHGHTQYTTANIGKSFVHFPIFYL